MWLLSLISWPLRAQDLYYYVLCSTVVVYSEKKGHTSKHSAIKRRWSMEHFFALLLSSRRQHLYFPLVLAAPAHWGWHFSKWAFSYSNSSRTTMVKKLCKSKKLVKSQSGHTEKPFADHNVIISVWPLCDLTSFLMRTHKKTCQITEWSYGKTLCRSLVIISVWPLCDLTSFFDLQSFLMITSDLQRVFPYDHSVIWWVLKFCKGIWVGTSILKLPILLKFNLVASNGCTVV